MCRSRIEVDGNADEADLADFHGFFFENTEGDY